MAINKYAERRQGKSDFAREGAVSLYCVTYVRRNDALGQWRGRLGGWHRIHQTQKYAHKASEHIPKLGSSGT